MSQVALANHPDEILAQAHSRALAERNESSGLQVVLVLGRETFRIELVRFREVFRVHVEAVDRDVDGGALRYDEVGSGNGVLLGAGAGDERKWGEPCIEKNGKKKHPSIKR